jgi:hypothetical protein
VLTSCQSSGTHLQSVVPTPTTSAVSTATSGTSPSSSSTTPAATSNSPSVVLFPTPTVSPAAAQGAVAAYLALVNATDEIDPNPAHADLAKLDRYLTGDAKTLFDDAYLGMKQAGLAYRGTPDTPRIRVLAVESPTAILLGDCPLSSTTDPYVQYNVKTGRPVPPATTPNPPPPYLVVLNMTLMNGQWKLARLVPDRSRTCTG